MLKGNSKILLKCTNLPIHVHNISFYIYIICLLTPNVDGEKGVYRMNRQVANIHQLSLPLKVIVERNFPVISQTPVKTIAALCEVT